MLRHLYYIFSDTLSSKVEALYLVFRHFSDRKYYIYLFTFSFKQVFILLIKPTTAEVTPKFCYFVDYILWNKKIQV